ncbi:MAG: ParB/RepB/Spo0J family partition protein, partial [Armatimonadota bacterium]
VETTVSAPTSLPLTSLVRNPSQPRKRFDPDQLEELAASIKELGILQPIVVRVLEGGKYEIVAGERRFRAAGLAGLTEVPVMVKAASAQVALEMSIVENVQRADISPIECALAYRRLADEFGMQQDEIANKVGKSRVAVSNTLRLLRLPNQVQEAVADGRISEGHARALLMIESPVRLEALYQRIVEEGLSVREAERLARGGTEARPLSGIKAPKPKGDANWFALSESISEYFGSPSKLAKTDKGGRLVVDFYSDDELQRILDKLGIG